MLKSRHFEWIFTKNGVLAVSGLDLGLELTTSFLRQNSSWACFSSTCSLPCIQPQALICTVSWNRRKSLRTYAWTQQDFSSQLTGSGSIQATCSLQLLLMEWERKAREAQASWNGKGRPEKLRPLVSLSTFSDLLWWPPQGLANSGLQANKLFHPNLDHLQKA